MGACYDCEFDFEMKKNEEEIVKELKTYMKKKENVRFLLPENKSIDSLTTIDEIMNIILAEHQGYMKTEVEENYRNYCSSFKATYGWESILSDIIDIMYKFVKDYSTFLVCVDNESRQLIVINGELKDVKHGVFIQ